MRVSFFLHEKAVFSSSSYTIACFSGTPKENDLYIAAEAKNAGIPVIVVRNKANQALEARMRRARQVNNDIICQSNLAVRNRNIVQFRMAL